MILLMFASMFQFLQLSTGNCFPFIEGLYETCIDIVKMFGLAAVNAGRKRKSESVIKQINGFP